jgi:Na+/melibiose symporter-like transporter
MAFVAIRAVTTIAGPEAYQRVFAVQWGLNIVGFAFIYFIPESPYFLIARGKIGKATRSITKLYGKDCDVQGRQTDIRASLAQDVAGPGESTGFAACFSKEHRKRTVLTLCMFFIQTQSGTAWVLGYIAFFLQLSGKSPVAANNISLVVVAMTLLGNVAGWPLIDKLGRRTVMVWGMFH